MSLADVGLKENKLVFKDDDDMLFVIGNQRYLNMYDPAKDLGRIMSFLTKRKAEIGYVYYGECGNTLNLPNPDEKPNRWIGYACKHTGETRTYIDIDEATFDEALELAMPNYDEFYIYGVK